MKKKIAILSEADSNDYNVARLKEESEKRQLEAEHLRYSQLITEYSETDTKVLFKGEDIIKTFDYFIFRSPLKKDGTYYGFHSAFLKYYVELQGKKTLNSVLKNSYFTNYYSKLSNYLILSKYGVPIIKSFNCMSFEQLGLIKEHLEFPLIVKNSKGSHGKGIELINNFDNLQKFFQDKNISQYLIQEYINTAEIKSDIRVVTLGNEVIGSYKKIASEGSIVTNLGSGGDAVEHPLTQDLLDIAKKIINALKVEFTGIDIIYKNDKPYVLEVNNAPQFRGFEKATKVNLAGKIIDYILTK
jgi:ribosomal protein S6--L-glutamate ligase